MSFTLYQLCFLFASALLLLLCFTTSCTGGDYEECYWGTCGSIEFSYPFGKINSSCGDPKFQLNCSLDSNPLLLLNGDEYVILQPTVLDSITLHNNSMTIVNYNLWKSMPGGSCNPLGNYSQFWWPDSQFRIAHGYTNLTLWGQCNESIKGHKRRLCGADWYVIPNPESGRRFCQSNIQLPVSLNFSFQRNEDLRTRLSAGFEITWYADTKRNRSCGACKNSGGSCGYNISEPTKTFICYCPDGTSHTDICRIGHKSRPVIVIGCSTGGIALVAIAVLLLGYCLKKRKSSSNFCKYERKDMEACVLGRETGDLPIFSYEALRQSTNCFHQENELGVGGFGSVYLGKLSDGRAVAVKRLSQDNSRRVDQFINEVKIFSTLNHPHIVRLYGCTPADGPELLLVYEFAPNGTLADHLHGDRKDPKGLPWNTRFNIAVQTAQALAFLHSVHPPILHRDVKSSNILLGENFIAKVADFGLCRLVPVDASHVTTSPQGTPGYLDPVYYQCYQLTEKSDMYSFGVVLVEIISARLAVDTNRKTTEINLATMAIAKIQEGALHELVDPQLNIEKNHEAKAMVCAVSELAFRCLASERDDRPHMEQVVTELEEIRHLCVGSSNGPGELEEGYLSNIKQLSTAPISPTSVEDTWRTKLHSQVAGYMGEEQLGTALENADVVIIPAGVPRKPGMTRDDLFNINAGIVNSLCFAIAKYCPEAIVNMISNPVNSTVPIAAEVFKKAGTYNEKKLFGVTTLDVVRAKTFYASKAGVPVEEVDVPVVGGHAGVTILPLFSQATPKPNSVLSEEDIKALTKRTQDGGTEVVEAKAGKGSATLSMAYAGAVFASSVLKGLNGEPNIVECSYVQSNVTELPFFASKVRLGEKGVEEVLGLGSLSEYEKQGLEGLKSELKSSIEKGIKFASEN